MGVEHPKEHFDVIGRFRNFKPMLIRALVAKPDLKLQLACHEMEGLEPHRKLLQKTAQHEKERLARLDFIFELECFFERIRDADELEQTCPLAVGTFPKLKAN